jgi:aryl-alcohol dehydrogenase-like predicted oxidoreductase
LSKLALGTVQFGLNYGISNKVGKTEIDEISKILNLASLNGITVLDTASVYGESEKLIGINNASQFKVVSKFSKSISTSDDLIESLKLSLENLKIESIYGYIAHDSDSLIEYPFLWDTLQNFKKKGLVKKIGYSLYFPEQLEDLLKLNYVPDLIQIPYNIIDQRFKDYFPSLKSIGCEIHARSIFLQGLFFVNPENLSSFFDPIKPFLLKLRKKFIDDKSLANFLIRYVLENPYIDKVVFGVNNEYQLKQNLLGFKESYNSKLIDFDGNCPDNILMPHKWPKLIN